MNGIEEKSALAEPRATVEADLPRRIIGLIDDFGSHDGFIRQEARLAAVAMGGPAVPHIAEALEHPDWHVRWEAALALGRIADPAAAPQLVAALRDGKFGVRWLAASALISIGPPALPALLIGLMEHRDSVLIRAGAHRVVAETLRRGAAPELTPVLAPLLKALEDVEPSIETPIAARAALDRVAA